MNEQDYNRLREAGWRRKLTENEALELQKHLAAHPELRAEWDGEAGLNSLLEKLPEAPAVSSNFTALVMQAVEREKAHEREFKSGWLGWRGIANWLPKAAVACLLVGLTFGGYQQYAAHDRVRLAKNAADLSSAVSAADPELMKDFEPIMRLGDTQAKADTELIALMK